MKALLKVWVAVICVLVTSAAVLAADGGLQQISPHVYAYVGAKEFSPATSYGANAGVIIGEKEVMVVDTLISAKDGERLLADIRKLTKLPIKYVVNTHYHLDHSWGNCALDKRGTQFIGGNGAAELAKTEGKKGLKNAGAYGLDAKQMKGTEIRPVDESLELPKAYDLGGVTVQVIPLVPGHCKDNLIVWAMEDKVMFSGDLLFAGCHPFMGESDVKGWVENLEVISGSGAEKIIPGHGPLCTEKDVQEMKAYLLAFEKNALELCKGKTPADAKVIAAELMKKLPAQNRAGLEAMIERNLAMKYLVPPQEPEIPQPADAAKTDAKSDAKKK